MGGDVAVPSDEETSLRRIHQPRGDLLQCGGIQLEPEIPGRPSPPRRAQHDVQRRPPELQNPSRQLRLRSAPGHPVPPGFLLDNEIYSGFYFKKNYNQII